MINKSDFIQIRNEIEREDLNREGLIRKSRDLIKLSKLIIYSVHRNDIGKAKTLLGKIKKEFIALKNIVKNNPGLVSSGAFKVSVQEYVEAICFCSFVNEKRLLTCKELGVNPEHYLLGLCDLTGELVRKAINAAIKGEYKEAFLIKDFVSELYGEFLLMDLRNGELRKKFDGIKYDLKKLEDLALDLKLKK